MRIGVSWPGTHGRRMWLSGGILFWIIAGYLILAVWLAVWVIALVVLALLQLGRGVGWIAGRATRNARAMHGRS